MVHAPSPVPTLRCAPSRTFLAMQGQLRPRRQASAWCFSGLSRSTPARPNLKIVLQGVIDCCLDFRRAEMIGLELQDMHKQKMGRAKGFVTFLRVIAAESRFTAGL